MQHWTKMGRYLRHYLLFFYPVEASFSMLLFFHEKAYINLQVTGRG